MSAAIRFQQVNKHYSLHHQRLIGIREAIPYLLKKMLRRPVVNNAPFCALRNCSFSIEEGDAVGIIGPNGAGKTTILKLVSGITRPTTGSVFVDGVVGSLIEIGAGFHGDLTGRENIYLYGAIMGLSKNEINARFDQIVQFSGLEAFIDTPVKKYSSGMYARLGFSVAAHIEHDILLVDEVLAVGDLEFRRKCHLKMNAIRDQGKTVVFVSHSLPAVEALCNKTIWLQNGDIRMYDQTAAVISGYINSVTSHQIELNGNVNKSKTSDIKITAIRFLNNSGQEIEAVRTNDSLTIEISYQTHYTFSNPEFGIAFFSEDGRRIATIGSNWDTAVVSTISGRGTFYCRLPSVPFLPDRYYLDFTIYDKNRLTSYFEWRKAKMLVVEVAENLYQNKILSNSGGYIFLKANWTHDHCVVKQPQVLERVLD